MAFVIILIGLMLLQQMDQINAFKFKGFRNALQLFSLLAQNSE